MNSFLTNKVCEILFVSVVIIHEISGNIKAQILEQLQYHHKSIDLVYSRGQSCKVVITDNFTLPYLQSIATNFETFIVDSSAAFLSTTLHPWLKQNAGISKVAMINGCPLPRLQYANQFLMNLEVSDVDVVLIDIDTFVLQDLRNLFTQYPEFDVGFTLGGHYVKKKDPKHFINLGVVFIHRRGIAHAAKLLDGISYYCAGMKEIERKSTILDQYSAFQTLEKYKINEKGSLLGRKLTGNCLLIDFPTTRPTRVMLLSEEYNTPGLKLYKSSQVAHFMGSSSKNIVIQKYGDVLLQFGTSAFLSKYARRKFNKARVTPDVVKECKNVIDIS